MTKDRLEIKDTDGSAAVFGGPFPSSAKASIHSQDDNRGWSESAEPLKATLTIVDDRAWIADVTEGRLASVGDTSRVATTGSCP